MVLMLKDKRGLTHYHCSICVDNLNEIKVGILGSFLASRTLRFVH